MAVHMKSWRLSVLPLDKSPSTMRGGWRTWITPEVAIFHWLLVMASVSSSNLCQLCRLTGLTLLCFIVICYVAVTCHHDSSLVPDLFFSQFHGELAREQTATQVTTATFSSRTLQIWMPRKELNCFLILQVRCMFLLHINMLSQRWLLLNAPHDPLSNWQICKHCPN